MTKDKALDSLRTFNRKWERIASYSFFTHTAYVKAHFEMIGSDKFSFVESSYPSNEAIDAVILNLRFFTQTGEDCSHHRISEAYTALQIKSHIENDFQSALENFKAWWNSLSGFEGMTNCRVYNVFVNGEAAHRNNCQLPQIYDEFVSKSQEHFFVALCGVVHGMMHHLGPIYYSNKRALDSML